MIRLGGRYTPPGRRGPRGSKGTPGVTAQPKDDGSIESAPTRETRAPPAVAPPTPPASGTYTPVVVNGAWTYEEKTP